MDSWKKTNEAYFGDSFDRSITLGPGTISFAVNNCNMNTDTLAKVSGYCDNYTVASADCALTSDTADFTIAKGVKDISGISISSVDTLSDRLNELNARIDDLKQNFVPKKGANKLRSALYTLQYKREVERL